MATIQWITNSGTSDWGVAGNWSSGVPEAADSATIGVSGTVTVTIDSAESVGSLTVADANATVALNSSLALGGLLALDAGKFVVNAGGILAGGTVAGGGMLLQGGTLSGVTVEGPLDLSANSTLHVSNGITLTGTSGTGAGSLLLTGAGSRLYFTGVESLSNAAVSIGAASYALLDVTGSGSTLTLAANLAMTQTGKYTELYANAGDALINAGHITDGVSGDRMLITGGGSFINQGQLSAMNGAYVSINTGVFANTGTLVLASAGQLHLHDSLSTTQLGSVSNSGGTLFINGTLDNSAHVLTSGSAGIGAVVLTGTLAGGTVAGNGMLFQNGTLSGVTVEGPLDLSPANSTLHVSNGITLTGTSGTGAGSLLLTGAGSRLYFTGVESLSNAAVSIGAASYALLDVTGSGSTLTLAANLTMTQTGKYTELYANAGDALINAGHITDGVSGDRMLITGGGTFVNQGLVSIANGGNLSVSSAVSGTGTIDLAGAAVVSLSGPVASGQVVHFDDATDRLVLVHPGSFDGTITGLVVGDTIDLNGFVAVDECFANNKLVLTNGTGGQVTIGIQGSFADSQFTLAPDGAGGTNVSLNNGPRLQAAPRDFNANGTSDILWRGNDGNVAIWEMNGLGVAGTAIVGFADPTVWQIKGTGDFDGDCRDEILWRDNTGNVAIWDVNGATVTGSTIFGFASPASWNLLATGDFNGDNLSDLLWRDSSGNVSIWQMNGASVAASAIVGFASPTVWTIQGTGDFNGDGKSDILWRSTTGAVDIWEMNGSSVAASGIIGSADPANWHIAGTGDFNGDGNSDILWQDKAGDVAIWEMNGLTATAKQFVGFADPSQWHIAGTGDFNGDFKTDILWHSNTGNVLVWEMNGFSIAASGLAGFADPTSWSIIPPDSTGAIPAAHN